MPRPAKWSDNEDALLRKLWLRGLKPRDIHTVMPHRSENSIEVRASVLSLKQTNPQPRKGDWSAEAKDYVKRKYAGGLSASQVAAGLAVEFNISATRNAVIGVIHRNGWSRGDGAYKSNSLPGRRAAAAKRVLSAPRFVPPQLRSGGLVGGGGEVPPALPMPKGDDPADYDKLYTLVELETHQCKWPVGEPRDPSFGFCGAKRVPGLPYCQGHAARAFVDPVKALRRAAQSDEAAREAAKREREEVDA